MSGSNAITSERTDANNTLLNAIQEVIRGDAIRVSIDTTHGVVDIYRNGACKDIIVVKSPTGKVFLGNAIVYPDAEGGLTISTMSLGTTAFWSLESKYYSFVTYY